MDDGLQSIVRSIKEARPLRKESPAAFDRRIERQLNKVSEHLTQTAVTRFGSALRLGREEREARTDALGSVRGFAAQLEYYYRKYGVKIFELVEEHLDRAARDAVIEPVSLGAVVDKGTDAPSIRPDSIKPKRKSRTGPKRNTQLEETRKLIRGMVGLSTRDICKHLNNHPLPPGASWICHKDWLAAYMSKPELVQSWISRARKVRLF